MFLSFTMQQALTMKLQLVPKCRWFRHLSASNSIQSFDQVTMVHHPAQELFRLGMLRHF
jgi:hypothetical protein